MKPYSYKTDGLVPKFDDTYKLIIFDGICHFCSRSMQIVFKHEKDGPISFAPVQSDLGRALLTHYGLDPDDPTSFLFLSGGEAKQSSSAVFALAKHLKGWPRLIRIFWILPRPLTDFAYKIFARNRYKWFGKADVCMVPSTDMKARFIGSAL